MEPYFTRFVAYFVPPGPHLLASQFAVSPGAIRAVAPRREIIEGSLVVAAIPLLIQDFRVHLRSG